MQARHGDLWIMSRLRQSNEILKQREIRPFLYVHIYLVRERGLTPFTVTLAEVQVCWLQ
jgi:hypothetical protein